MPPCSCSRKRYQCSDRENKAGARPRYCSRIQAKPGPSGSQEFQERPAATLYPCSQAPPGTAESNHPHPLTRIRDRKSGTHQAGADAFPHYRVPPIQASVPLGSDGPPSHATPRRRSQALWTPVTNPQRQSPLKTPLPHRQIPIGPSIQHAESLFQALDAERSRNPRTIPPRPSRRSHGNSAAKFFRANHMQHSFAALPETGPKAPLGVRSEQGIAPSRAQAQSVPPWATQTKGSPWIQTAQKAIPPENRPYGFRRTRPPGQKHLSDPDRIQQNADMKTPTKKAPGPQPAQQHIFPRHPPRARPSKRKKR